MPPRHLTRRSRHAAAVVLAGASLVTFAAVGSIFLTTARDATTAIGAAGPAGPADGILLVTGLGGALLSLWLGLGMTLSALSALPGALGQLSRRLADRVAPAAMRKAVAFVLGTTLTAAFVPGTAVAGIGHETVRPAVVAAATHAMSGLLAAPDASFRQLSDPPLRRTVPDAAPPPAWEPDRPGSPRRIGSPTRSAPVSDNVVVHRGDTLWCIAARHLGPEAKVADIDAEWRRWLTANRDLIGDNADLILPGQVLSPPPLPRVGR